MCRAVIVYFLCLILIPVTFTFGYGIVQNGADRDSISIPFMLLDSLGNPAALNAGDSVYLAVHYPGGAVAYKDSMAHDDGSIVSNSWEDFTDGISYVYTAPINAIDGFSPVNGLYSYVLMVDDNSGADLVTGYSGYFQVVNSPLESSLDSAAFAQKAVDSLAKVIDSLENYDEWVSDIDSAFVERILSRYIDSVWNEDSTGHFSPPNMAYVAARTGSDTSLIRGLLESDRFIMVPSDSTESGSGLITYSGGIDSTMRLKQLIVEGDNGTGASVKIENISGTAVAIGVSGGIGHGLYLEGHGGGFDLNGDIHGAIDSVRYVSKIAADTIANRVKEDSLVYRGGGSGDSASIARWVWNTPQDNHTGDGTFGKYLDAEISGVGVGGGLYSFRITAYDSSIDQTISGARVIIRNLAQTSLIALGSTDSQGEIEFNLDADSFLVAAYSHGYVFNAFDTVVVSGGGEDTIRAYRFDPGQPSDPALCRVWGFLYDLTGRPESGSAVSAWLPSGTAKSGGLIITPSKVETVSDSTGYFYLDLIPGGDLEPDGTMYEITINRSDGTILREGVDVPDQPVWQLTW